MPRDRSVSPAASPRDARAWLIAAASISAKTYLQRRGLPAGDDEADDTRVVLELLLQRDALQTLPALARDALRLRFAERKTYPEIGTELGISPYAAERIVAKAFMKLRSLRREPHDE
ncbi:MAG TPA: sigma factor-like helix-turn-helix DNA-binding protein [Thermoanaerobaculia bacterium]|nr:sigma factor-like helix-turn-helix DNA-binding protein [Thermoanaerobaculia bacterium]